MESAIRQETKYHSMRLHGPWLWQASKVVLIFPITEIQCSHQIKFSPRHLNQYPQTPCLDSFLCFAIPLTLPSKPLLQIPSCSLRSRPHYFIYIFPLQRTSSTLTVVKMKVTQLCLSLCDPMNCVVHGIL